MKDIPSRSPPLPSLSNHDRHPDGWCRSCIGSFFLHPVMPSDPPSWMRWKDLVL